MEAQQESVLLFYALRANKKVLLLEKEVVGGKIISTPFIENYPGILEIKGMDLSENLNKQVIAFGGEIKMEKVIKIEQIQNKQQVITTSGKYIASAIILATGTKYKRLGIENEEKWIGKGISFCATCDGFFYQNKVSSSDWRREYSSCKCIRTSRKL